jgi:uncharacterized protein
MSLDQTHLIFLLVAVGAIAFLYSSVGHAGASGYIAVMALWRLCPVVIKPTALLLNILVATNGAFQFCKAAHFSWELFWPFALLSVPAAYFGGYVQLPAAILKTLIGLVLIFSAVRLVFRPAIYPRQSRARTKSRSPLVEELVSSPVSWGQAEEYFSHLHCLFSVGQDSSGGRGFGVVYFGQLDLRSGGIFQRQAHHSLARFRSRAGGRYLRGARFLSWRRRFPARTISLLLATVLLIAGIKLIFTR